jgi:hypothetical protein
MATLYVSYFGSVDKLVAGDPIKTETVTTSTESAATGEIPDGAVIASLFSDTAHYVTIGTDTPTAAITNSFYLPANQMRELRTFNGHGAARKIAAITLA